MPCKILGMETSTHVITYPLITCVCPTSTARKHYFNDVVAMFKAQTYPNKRLLFGIEAEGSASSGLHVLEDHPRISICLLPKVSLGLKRNLLNSYTSGSLIAHFDDDDWSAPSRLMDQYQHLRASTAAIIGFSQMKFTDGVSWWQYIGDPTWPLGTSLLYRRDYWEKNQFPDIQVASDTVFINHARIHRSVESIPCRNRMFARVHSSNTSKKDMQNSSTYKRLHESEAVRMEVA